MSMRDYPVFEYGLVLNAEEMMNLLKTYNGKIENLSKEEVEEIVENNDWGAIDDLTYNELSEFERIGAFDGEFQRLIDRETIYFNDDEIYVFGLKQFNVWDNSALYTSYGSMQEIFDEVKESLIRLGFNVDEGFVRQNIGKVWGTYFG